MDEYPPEEPSWTKSCVRCNTGTVTRWRGQGDVCCDNPHCTAEYNASGQLLRDNWAENPAWRDDNIDDLEGDEIAALARDNELDD